MDKNRIYKRPHQPIRNFQGETADQSEESSDHSTEPEEQNLQGAVATSEQLINSTGNQILFVAMLDFICQVHEPDPSRARMLYKTVSQHLRHLNLMNSMVTVDEMCSLRSQYKSVFNKLIQGCLTHLKRDLRPQDISQRTQLWLQPHISPNIIGTLFGDGGSSSRFHDEYLSLGTLGEGGYGRVIKARNKLDEQDYAVKEIAFHGDDQDEWFKVLREVKTLAGLSHKHIVRYYQAWFENKCFSSSGSLLRSSNSGFSRRMLEAKERPVEPIDLEHNEDYSSDSIVFEHSGNHPVLQNESAENSRFSSHSSEAPFLIRNAAFVYIQMELCDTTLTDWLTERNQAENQIIDKEMNLKILSQILKAVAYIHSKDIIHRDLKPQNIFINNKDLVLKEASAASDITVKLGDFGLSRYVRCSTYTNPSSDLVPLTPAPGFTPVMHFRDEAQDNNHLVRNLHGKVTLSASDETEENNDTSGEDSDNFTLYTSGVGTTTYASPEQLQGSDYSEKADMYSIGLIMFEMYQPFTTESERRICLKRLRDNKLPLDFKEQWSVESKYIESLLSHDPNKRLSAKELLESELFKSKDQIIENLRCCLKTTRDENQAKDCQIKSLKEELAQRDAKITELENKLALYELQTLAISNQNLKNQKDNFAARANNSKGDG